jgi:hypothetical protein
MMTCLLLARELMAFYFSLPIECAREVTRDESVEENKRTYERAPTCIAGNILLPWWRESFGEFVDLILN